MLLGGREVGAVSGVVSGDGETRRRRWMDGEREEEGEA